jgi:hypothetical protein
MLATKCVSMHSDVDGSSSSRRDSQPIDSIQFFTVYIPRLIRYNSLKSKGKDKEMTTENLVLTFLIIGGILGNWYVTKRIVANTAALNAKMRKK